VHNSKLKRITVALCMALVPISVFAAGLGKLNVMSGLGEPLKADIELISVTPEELNSLTAAIASEEAYVTQGLERSATLNTIKVAIAKNAAGSPILKLNSSQPISEPFLDMLIQVDWASGRLLREYTVLLDPPGYTGETEPSAAQTAQVPVVRSADAMPSDSMQGGAKENNTTDIEPIAKAPSVKKRGKSSRVKPTEEVMASGDASGEYVTHSGDTLAKIARAMKPDGVSLEQMLVGLYQTNPNAFQGENMNRLKVGQIIRQPSEETLNSITRKEASSEIKVQTANWNAYRNKLAGIVADTTPSDTEASTQSAGGKIKSAAEDKSMPAAAGPKDVVKLSAGEAAAAKASADNVKSLQDKITALQEEATAREKSVKEAQDRTASLEKQIADMQKLLALKNGEMADLQKQAEVQASAEKSKPAEVVAAPIEATKPVETTAEQVKPVEQVNPAPVDKPKPKPEVAPAPEQSFLESLFAGLDLTTLLPAGGLLALLGGGWLYLRKKRERSLADFEQGIMTSGGLKANTVFGNTGSASVDTGDTSFLTDFSQSANGGMIDTNDVDPIAEAEVYMAYGRDAQAEEILKDAISKEPKRYELHLKLLEMYAASKNLSAFETIAGELYTTLGAEDPTWAKVAEIGIKLEPNNPLYQANSNPTGSIAKPADAGDKLDANDFSDSPLAAEKDLDFSFDNEALTQDFAPDTVIHEADAVVPEAAVAELEIPISNEAVVDNNSDAMEFDLGNFGDLNTAESAAPAEEPVQMAAPEFGNTMPSLDMDTFAEPKFMPEVSAELEDTIREQAGAMPELNEIKLEGFDSAQEITESREPGVLDISGLDTQADEAGKDSGFSFAVDTIMPEVGNFKEDDHAEASTFDLTTINLDLNEDSAKPAESVLAENEPIEVETKLDLVVAYIEMDDKEGAKELLDEVMKEGGANQRKRAEEFLAKLA
jgi:pilus assembly protein FimV